MVKKYLWIPLLGLGVSAMAQTGVKTYQLEGAPRYSEATGYGYDLVETPVKGSKSPFFFSVRVPDGNYKGPLGQPQTGGRHYCQGRVAPPVYCECAYEKERICGTHLYCQQA